MELSRIGVGAASRSWVTMNEKYQLHIIYKNIQNNFHNKLLFAFLINIKKQLIFMFD
jgi:hypothetical protein